MTYKLKSKTNLALILLLLIFVYFSFIGSFSNIHLFNIIISIFVFAYYLFKNMRDIILLKLIVYLMFFDINDLFTFGGVFNLRIWYFIVIFLLIKVFIVELRTPKIRFKISNVILAISMIVLSLFSIFINGSSMDGILFLMRLIVFYFPVLFLFIKLINEKMLVYDILFFFTSMILFSTLTGIIQMFFLTQGNDILYSVGTMRPQAYFSETTWYSEYAVIGLIVALIQQYERKIVKYFILFINVLAVVLSMTRNAILGLLVVVVYILFVRRKKEEVVALIAIISVALISYGFALTKSDYLLGFEFITDKFNLSDASALGRLDAIKANIEYLMDTQKFLWGSGFSFNDASELSGSAIGAKSFNLFLAVFSSAGNLLFLIFSFTIGRIYIKYFSNTSRNAFNSAGLLMFTVYLIYSMFAPFHFYPLSWFVLGLSLILIRFPKNNLQYN